MIPVTSAAELKTTTDVTDNVARTETSWLCNIWILNINYTKYMYVKGQQWSCVELFQDIFQSLEAGIDQWPRNCQLQMCMKNVQKD